MHYQWFFILNNYHYLVYFADFVFAGVSSSHRQIREGVHSMLSLSAKKEE